MVEKSKLFFSIIAALLLGALILVGAIYLRLGNHSNGSSISSNNNDDGQIVASSTIIITEIMYHQKNCNESMMMIGEGEWIELYNNGDSNVDLSGWTIGDQRSAMIETIVPAAHNNNNSSSSSSTVLEPGDYYILGRSFASATTVGVVNRLNDDDVVVNSTFSFQLGTETGDEVILRDRCSAVVDTHKYDNAPVPVTTCHSVQRTKNDSGVPTNTWEEGPWGGSPRFGYNNTYVAVANDKNNNVMITEIMYNPVECSDSTGEWIELYNAGVSAVDLEGWTVSETSSVGGTARTTLPSLKLEAGAYFVLGRTIDGCGGLNADATFDFSLNNNGGDTVTLRDSTSEIIDEHTYASGDAAKGKTVQRATDGLGAPSTDTWEEGPYHGSPRAGYNTSSISSSRPPVVTKPPPAVANVKISEIMYNPSKCSDTSGEWIELYNAGAASVDLTGWKVQDIAGGSKTLDSFVLVGRSYFILGRTIDGCDGDLSADTTFSFALNNDADTIFLIDDGGVTIDEHAYSGSDASAGNTIQLDPDLVTWVEGPSGGTPRSGYEFVITTPCPLPTMMPTTGVPTILTPTETTNTMTTTIIRTYQAYELELVCGSTPTAGGGYARRFTYELVGPDIGNEARPSSFYYDRLQPTLPPTCQQWSLSSYSHPGCDGTSSSGRRTNPFCYDRGHLVMANHLDNDGVAIYQSNYMTNILPQATGFNQAGGAWIYTEEIIECARDIVNVERQVIFGGAFFLDASNDYFLKSHGIPTPDLFWKVVVRHHYTNTLPEVNAWVMPNEYTSLKELLPSYETPISQIKDMLIANGESDDLPELPALYNEVPTWEIPSGCDLS